MRVLGVAAAALSLAGSAWAQATEPSRQYLPPKVTTSQLKGEVATFKATTSSRR